MSAIVSPIREPLIRGSKTYHQITEDLCAATERAPSLAWILAFGAATTALSIGMFCIIWTI